MNIKCLTKIITCENLESETASNHGFFVTFESSDFEEKGVLRDDDACGNIYWMAASNRKKIGIKIELFYI